MARAEYLSKEAVVKPKHVRGFTLIELLIAVVIIGVISAVAFPSYKSYMVRAARLQAQSELLQLSSLQEKIYLNSNAYAFSVTAGYDGTSAGGLGRTSGTTNDGKYQLSLNITAPSQTFVLTATPTTGGSQVGDGNISISESGQRLWGTGTW
jgi:type IV pilus assembly protein PilE